MTDTPRRAAPALVSLGLAVLLVVLVFPEVVFGGGSFSVVPFDRVLGQPQPPATVQGYPDIGARSPTSGMVDVGARTWQYEPTTRYMARVLRNGSNPDWNPYQASGSLGPETLDGMQLSPVVLAVAALGASGAAFTVVQLAMLVLALYCLQQLFVRSLDMHRLAGLGAGVVFLLNGWATATFTDVTCVPYLLFPVVLYAVVELQRRPGPARLLAAVAAYATLFASTFSPGQALDVLLITVVALVIDAWRRRRDRLQSSGRLREVAVLVGRQALVPAIALAVVAVIVLPAFDAFRHAGSDVTSYSAQHLFTRSPARWLVLPSYLLNVARPAGILVGWQVYLGLTPIVVVAAALARARDLARWLLVVLVGLALFGLSQHMGLPDLKVIGDLPGLRIITNDYWASLTAAAVVLAFGVALDVVQRRGLSLAVVIPAVAVLDLVVLEVARSAAWSWPAELAVLVSASVFAALLALGWSSDRGWVDRRLVAVLAVALVAAELGAYANHTYARRSAAPTSAGFVRYLQTHVGDGRVLDIGSSTMLGDWGSALGIREIGTLDIMQLPWYRSFFLRYVGGTEDGKFLALPRDASTPFTADATALDLLSVRYLVVSDSAVQTRHDVAARYPLAYRDEAAGVSVYANPGAWSRSFLSPALRAAPASTAAATASPVVGPAPTPLRLDRSTAETGDPVLLAEARRAGIPSQAPATAGSSGRSTIVRDDSTEVALDVDAARPSVLVLADTYHPNWTVTVDGVTQHVGRVDEVARGVVVPAGHSVVVFRYHSAARAWGWVISILALLGLLAVCLVWARRRRVGHGAARTMPT